MVGFAGTGEVGCVSFCLNKKLFYSHTRTSNFVSGQDLLEVLFLLAKIIHFCSFIVFICGTRVIALT